MISLAVRVPDAEQILVGGAIGLDDFIGSGDFFVEEEFVEEAEFLRGEDVGAKV
jgi:hypothetical protein